LLGYFRINDPYRLVIIFFLVMLLRLPYLISSEWLSIPELRWLLVGETLNEGDLLYVDILDDIGPLSAYVYSVLNFLFGRSQLAIQIFGLILFCFQVFYINHLALKHKMYNENNYLPALFYGILGLSSFNLITLSPIMMGLTFILFSLNGLLTQIESRNKTDANLINIGIFTGLALLFYIPFFWMLLVHMIILLFFTNTLGRRYLLMIYGVLVPVSIIWLIYIWQGETKAFYANYFFSIFAGNAENLLGKNTLLILFGFTILLYLISSIKILNGLGFNIFQVRIQKTMFFVSLVILGIWFLYSNQSGEEMIMFLPWVAFFLSHFFLSIRNRLKRELTFFIYMFSIIALYLGFTFHLFSLDQLIKFSPALIKIENTSEQPIYANQKILVLGTDIQPYYFGKVSTPYFNWEISKKELENLNYYDNLEQIDRKIRSDMPDYIIDQVGLAPRIFERIPLLGKEFSFLKDGLYKKDPMSN
jgi:hypothetical protein